MAELINTTDDYTGRQVDLEMFRSPERPVSIWPVQMKMNINGGPRRVTAIQKLVQRYANLLLQTVGSIQFDTDAGSSLFKDLQIGSPYTAAQCLHSFTFANAQVVSQLQTEDANPTYGTPVEDEMINDAILLDLEKVTDTLRIRVQITTLSGNIVTFTIPMGQV
jgi:hypothetical protein